MNIFTDLSLEWYGIVISICSFLAAVYAIIYTHLSNRLRIHITNYFYDQRPPDPPITHFTFQNLSNKPIVIIDLVFLDPESQKTITPLLGFKPTPTYSNVGLTKIPDLIGPYWEECILKGPLVIQPHTDKSFSYYFNPFQNYMTIKITLDKKRLITRKHIQKSFVINMKQSN